MLNISSQADAQAYINSLNRQYRSNSSYSYRSSKSSYSYKKSTSSYKPSKSFSSSKKPTYSYSSSYKSSSYKPSYSSSGYKPSYSSTKKSTYTGYNPSSYYKSQAQKSSYSYSSYKKPTSSYKSSYSSYSYSSSNTSRSSYKGKSTITNEADAKAYIDSLNRQYKYKNHTKIKKITTQSEAKEYIDSLNRQYKYKNHTTTSDSYSSYHKPSNNTSSSYKPSTSISSYHKPNTNTSSSYKPSTIFSNNGNFDYRSIAYGHVSHYGDMYNYYSSQQHKTHTTTQKTSAESTSNKSKETVNKETPKINSQAQAKAYIDELNRQHKTTTPTNTKTSVTVSQKVADNVTEVAKDVNVQATTETKVTVPAYNPVSNNTTDTTMQAVAEKEHTSTLMKIAATVAGISYDDNGTPNIEYASDAITFSKVLNGHFEDEGAVQKAAAKVLGLQTNSNGTILVDKSKQDNQALQTMIDSLKNMGYNEEVKTKVEDKQEKVQETQIGDGTFISTGSNVSEQIRTSIELSGLSKKPHASSDFLNTSIEDENKVYTCSSIMTHEGLFNIFDSKYTYSSEYTIVTKPKEEWLKELEKYEFYLDKIKPDLDAIDFAIGEAQGIPEKVKIASSIVNCIIPGVAEKYIYIKKMTDIYDGDIPICESVLVTKYDVCKNGDLIKRSEKGYGVN